MSETSQSYTIHLQRIRSRLGSESVSQTRPDRCKLQNSIARVERERDQIVQTDCAARSARLRSQILSYVMHFVHSFRSAWKLCNPIFKQMMESLPNAFLFALFSYLHPFSLYI